MPFSEQTRCVVYYFLSFQELTEKISKISRKERIMLITKYSKVLDVKKNLDVFESFRGDIEYAIALAKEVTVCKLPKESLKISETVL